jgi:carbamate kinase
MSRVVVALGGNAIQRAHDSGTWEEATRQMRRTAGSLASVVREGHELVVTHGNGPQVGVLLQEEELAASKIPVLPMYVAGAETEGQIGFLVAQELSSALSRVGRRRAVIPVVSRTEVSRRDPAFRSPSKPVGSFYSAQAAQRLHSENGWTMQEDKERGGWRRVVPSPIPLRWLEGEAIRAALDAGLGSQCVFVVTGGGGVPVVPGSGGHWVGVDAVIDKDLAAALAARQLNASDLIIVTDVPGAAVGFGTPHERWLGRVTAQELGAYLRKGEFAAGSMGPKVEAILDFVRHGGRRAVISDIPSLSAAIHGEAGTQVEGPGAPPGPSRLRRSRRTRGRK